MLICSIDLMDGRAVQLRQGKTHVLTDDRDPVALAAEFSRYGEVAVIDLDAALGTGKDNLALIEQICQVADVRAGGGVRDKERAVRLLKAGARQIIVGTAATPEFLSSLPRERVMVALDHLRSGEVVDQGWTQGTGETLQQRAERLAPYCSGFLCTFVEDEGGMGGIDLDAVKHLKATLPHPVTVAGGVKSTEDASAVCRLGVDVQVGMALYTGALDPVEVVVGSLAFDKFSDGLMPTVVQAEVDGTVLMLAYSSADSLRQALRDGVGTYYSRSRQALWVKGATSGHTQQLLACRPDCDQDALLFRVRQTGPACHRDTQSCFSTTPEPFKLSHLFLAMRQRLQDMPEGSYTTKLLQDPKLLYRKLMEEAFEVVQAETLQESVWELGDLFYFATVIAVSRGVKLGQIEAELSGRVRPKP